MRTSTSGRRPGGYFLLLQLIWEGTLAIAETPPKSSFSQLSSDEFKCTLFFPYLGLFKTPPESIKRFLFFIYLPLSFASHHLSVSCYLTRAVRISFFFVVCLLFVFFMTSMERIVISHIYGTTPDHLHLTIHTPRTFCSLSANGKKNFTKSRTAVINFLALRDAHGHCRFFEMLLKRLQ